MKIRFYILTFFLSVSLVVLAQDHFDALRVSQSDISGTARYVSMGGALGALGGDVSAVKDNPAAIGVYRASEIAFTLNVQNQNSVGKWNNVTSNEGKSDFNFNQIAYVINFPTQNKLKGLVSSSFSMQYNRIKDFDRTYSVKASAFGSSMTDYMAGYTQKGGLSSSYLFDNALYNGYDSWEGDWENNIYPGWLSVLSAQGGLITYDDVNDNWHSILSEGETVDPAYIMRETGCIDEYNFTWAGNFSHKFYVGASLNIRSIEYRSNSIYSEDFAGGGYFDFDNELYMNASGVNLGVGVIARPLDYLRLGLAFQSPSWLVVNESNYAKIESLTDKKHYTATPRSSVYSTYNLRSPLKLNGSAALVLGHRGLMSVEYNFEDYVNMKLSDPDYGAESFIPENDYVKEDMQNVHTVKMGLEFNILPGFSARAGYAIQSASTKQIAYRGHRDNSVRTDTQYLIDKGTQYASMGLGYRNKNWILDLAYQYKTQQENFHAFRIDDNAGSVSLASNWHNIVLTMGCRF